MCLLVNFPSLNFIPFRNPKKGVCDLIGYLWDILILLMQSDPESDVLIMVIITTLYYYLTGICIGHFIIIVPVV